MNIFVDFHHTSLLKSFQLLFERRLGHHVFRPIGEEWYQEGYWRIYDHPDTVKQFLSVSEGIKLPDGTPELNRELGNYDGIYMFRDPDGESNIAITLEEFKRSKIDIVIATIPDHIKPFQRLIATYKPNAKFIFQAGNNFDLSRFKDEEIPNILASANLSLSGRDVNLITYHQEFDTDNVFTRADIPPKNAIYSFVNCFQESPDYQIFIDLEASMTDYEFKSFGGQCRDGFCTGHMELAGTMKEAKYILHLKPGGDGYGHVVFNAAAIGRPLVVNKSYYKGQLAEKLMIDMETCITTDGLSIPEIKSKIESVDDAKYQAMCDNLYSVFKKEVDFARESEDIKEFLSNLR